MSPLATPPAGPARRPCPHSRRISARTALAGPGTAAICLVGAAVEMAAGVVGAPQPAAAQFRIPGGSAGGASVALLADGSYVIADEDDDNATRVCHIVPGARSCASDATLSLDGGDEFANPEVVTPGGRTVDVLVTGSANTYLFTSTDDGATFGAPVAVGTVTSTAAALVDGTLVWTQGDSSAGLELDATSVTSPALSPSPTVIDGVNDAFDVGLGDFDGRFLLAGDTDTTEYTTTLRLLPSGDAPTSANLWATVGTLPNEQLIGVSGNAILTEVGNNADTVRLRRYTDSGLSAPSTVPGASGGGPEWFAVVTDPAGRVHALEETARTGYELQQVVTSDGVHWSAPQSLGDAVVSDGFAGAYSAKGSGFIAGVASDLSSTPVYPVLNGQDIKIAIRPSSVVLHAHATVSGKSGPVLPDQLVQLEVERSHKWYVVAHTRESHTGTFTFRVAATKVGTFDYRAVVAGETGAYLIGYSNSAALRVRR